MRRDALPVVSDPVLLELRAMRELLERIEQNTRQNFQPSEFDPADADLLREIAAYVGSLAKFSAAEILESADDRLRLALGDRDAACLGRELSNAAGCVVVGLRLTHKGRGVDGNVWMFEPA